MKIEPLYLKKADVINLQKRDLEIGRGNDGIVYKTGISNSDELYKLYFRKSKIGSEPCYLELVDEKDAVDNIYKAIDRQSYVKRTKLQKRPIYINNRFRGVVIHYHKKKRAHGGPPPARATIGYFHVPPVIPGAARNPLVTLDVAGGRFLAALEMTGGGRGSVAWGLPVGDFSLRSK